MDDGQQQRDGDYDCNDPDDEPHDTMIAHPAAKHEGAPNRITSSTQAGSTQ